ncbi:MAG: hypothetical protein JW881_05530 [Spirochaetales bacterium]|nr:hypothetical protein [Spirochaetales bacterium]
MTDKFKGELDPAIAELISQDEGRGGSPSLDDIIGTRNAGDTGEAVGMPPAQFKKIIETEESPKSFFREKDYYKKVIAGEGDAAARVHELLSKFLNAGDPQDKSMFRGRLISAYWNLAAAVASKVTATTSLYKKCLLRYGLLSPTLLSSEQLSIISRIILENRTDEPVHYLDEWMIKIAAGEVGISATDELKRVKKDEGQKMLDKIDQAKGQRDSEILLLKNKIAQRDDYEIQLIEMIKVIRNHDNAFEFDGLEIEYSPEQKRALSSVSDILKKLGLLDREIVRCCHILRSIDQNIETLDKKTEGISGTAADTQTVISEFTTIRQMNKLCVGRKGNHFPILIKHYFRPNFRELGTRENIINQMARVEELDPGLFLRTYKNRTTRIVPHLIILPNYGERGICWEPFERKNRATGRGRIAVPLFTKNLRLAVISALADLRWQVAKEKALHYWMEEGITGHYYRWFESRKLRGDVKEYFINDYILWITKECEGTQKLDREVRGIFWRLIPFPQEIKDKLRNRGFVYNDLYKKDINISRSDGY